MWSFKKIYRELSVPNFHKSSSPKNNGNCLTLHVFEKSWHLFQ